ncbi:MAG TPA: hypothetical protein VN493_31755 [Thermoanaerobaculia bacterium]|nr:hypothetical protein [Thermoanaerobaculia bacterium]
MSLPSTRLLTGLAWGNAALHGVGLVLALVGMRPGSSLVPLPERMAYLAGRPAGWTWGWGVWMLCSLLLLGYVAALRRHLPDRSIAADLAFVLTAAGMGVDLLCDVLQIRGLPLAAGSGSEPLFLSLESLAFTGGATVANGLYTAAVLILTLELRGRIGTAAQFAGLATAVFGSAMAVAGLIPSPNLLEVATGPTIGFYSLWTILVARDLR